MSRVLMNRACVALASFGLLAVAGCSSTEPPAGRIETIDVGGPRSIELFVPEGWYLESMETADAVVDPASDRVFVLADEARLPRQVLEGAIAGDPGEEFDRLTGQGAAVSVVVSVLGPCAEIESQVDELDATYAELMPTADTERVDDAFGSTASAGSVPASDSPGVAWLYSAVPVGNDDCVGVALQKFSDQDTADADRQQLVTIARNSGVAD